MNTPSIRKLILTLAMLLVVLACAVPGLPLPAASSPSPTDTLTSTPLPTSTPTNTPTTTATFLLATATKPPTATEPFVTQGAGSNCELVDQLPSNDTTYASRARFTAEWTLKNTGSASWLSSDVDFSRSSGKDMSAQDVYDLPNNVGPDAQVTFAVDMRAPADSGTYTSTWRLGSKNKPLCEVFVRIIVK
jgi:Ig-like domain from next to BRCA1 gene